MDTTTLEAEFGRALGLEIRDLGLIQSNKDCSIYRARDGERPVIIKSYLGHDPGMIRAEAGALDLYQGLAARLHCMMGSGVVKCDPDHNLLAISFVEGEPFSRLLHASGRNVDLRRSCLKLMNGLGRFLRLVHLETVCREMTPSPFLREYLDHCSRRLEEIPVLGRWLFGGSVSGAARLWDQLMECAAPPSFSHGDLVLGNIHVSGEKLGLIDFGNPVSHGHLLNDVYSLRIALDDTWLPVTYRNQLLEALCDGIGDLYFPRVLHRFYYEYNRRRWLMLRWRSRNPVSWYRATRGQIAFARPTTTDLVPL